MTKFESINFKNIDEFAEWLDKYGVYDSSPWMEWWNENYCQKCETVTMTREEYANIAGWYRCPDYCSYIEDTVECGYCEVNGKCRYFQDMDEVPSNKEIIKMWLQTKA